MCLLSFLIVVLGLQIPIQPLVPLVDEFASKSVQERELNILFTLFLLDSCCSHLSIPDNKLGLPLQQLPDSK